MKILTAIAIFIVAALHLGFLILEMFLWQGPVGLDVLGMTVEQASATATLAANQGLYNGFLGAGLLWGLLARKRDVTVFFLPCGAAAGLYGAATASVTVLFIQAVPAVLALGLTLWVGGSQSGDSGRDPLGLRGRARLG